MFGQGNFRPLMGELRLAQAPDAMAPAPTSVPAPASVAPAPAPATTPIPVAAPSANTGISTGVKALAVATGLTILGLIFFTD